MTRTENGDTGVVLKPGRERSVRNRHPWLFSGAIASQRGTPRVRAQRRAFLEALPGEDVGRFKFVGEPGWAETLATRMAGCSDW